MAEKKSVGEVALETCGGTEACIQRFVSKLKHEMTIRELTIEQIASFAAFDPALISEDIEPLIQPHVSQKDFKGKEPLISSLSVYLGINLDEMFEIKEEFTPEFKYKWREMWAEGICADKISMRQLGVMIDKQENIHPEVEIGTFIMLKALEELCK